MLNPFKLIAVYGDLNKMQSIWNEKGDVMQKLTQYLALVVSLAGTLGVPALAQHWLAAPSHKVVYTCLVAVAILLHAIFPSVFADPSDAVKKSTGLGVILLMLAFAGTASAQTVAPTANTVLDLVSGSGCVLIGAERAGITCLAADLAEAYVDCTVVRWANLTEREPTLLETGETFAQVTARRIAEREAAA